MSAEQKLLDELRQHQISTDLGYAFELNRRELFRLLGGGLLVCVATSALAQEPGRRPGGRNPAFHPQQAKDGLVGGPVLPGDIGSWIHIAESGAVTVFTGKVEMGQNIRTSLTQQVAEELHAPLDSIKLLMGDTQLTPFDMGTFGSRTTPTMGRQLREVASAARAVLINLAAEQWGVDSKDLIARDGAVVDPRTGRSIGYGELTKGKQLVQMIGQDPILEPASEWTIAGKPVPKVDGRAFVTGEHQYTSDLTRPGMLCGKVLRPTAFKARLVSLDSSAAEKLPGVTVVRDGNFAGVTAPDPHTAQAALAALRATWEASQQPSETELHALLRRPPATPPSGFEAPQEQRKGALEQGYASAGKQLKQTYTVAYIAHAPLEPRAAVAEWNDGQLTVWTGTQRPFAVRDELAEAFRLPNEKVRVLVPDTGSAYGGKHTGDAAVEAARLAKSAGKPVKLVWTRKEEFTWAYFRPAGVIDAAAGVTQDGVITAWEFDNYNSGPAALGTPYNIANQRIAFHPADSPLRQGSYRALAATANHFARESFMDELAHLVQMDPLAFRIKNISDPRLHDVLARAAGKFGWGRRKPAPGTGFGMAGGFEKGGYVAACAEVAVDGASGVVRIVRVVEAFDCGAVVNPNGLQNQISGAITQGIGGALFEAIRFQNGRILNPHFADYRVPCFADVPQIEVEIINRKDQPSFGAGETPIVALAPAVANAIFMATGVRLRGLPLAPNGVPPLVPIA